MRWEGRRESDMVEDRRDGGFGGGFPGGGGIGIPIRLGGGGIGTLLIMLLIAWVLGINPLSLLGGGPVGPGPSQFDRQVERPSQRTEPARDQGARFVSVVLADTEDRFGQLVPTQLRRPYQRPGLVLFSGATRSGCGAASQEVGPFYCPLDRKVYIDLQFYQDLKNRFRAPGDFAQAYVIAHEVGHHIQNLTGVLGRFNEYRQRVSEREANAMSVRVELQADCYAGVWAHHANRDRGFIEEGDIEEALNAAARIGDDAIQKSTRGRVVPDSFTHGSSEQRQRWFTTGFRSGDLRECNTFETDRL